MVDDGVGVVPRETATRRLELRASSSAARDARTRSLVLWMIVFTSWVCAGALGVMRLSAHFVVFAIVGGVAAYFAANTRADMREHFKRVREAFAKAREG